MSTVVNDLRRTHGCSCLSIVKTHTIATTGNEIGVHTKSTHGIHSYLTYLVLGQFADKVSVVTKVGTADGHIGLATTWDDAELISLHKSVISFWTEAKHKFAHCDNLHIFIMDNL